MEKGRIEITIISGTGGNSEQNGNMQIFFYINNWVFSKTIWRKKRCSLMAKGHKKNKKTSMSFLEPGGTSVQNDNVQLFF